MKMQYLEQSGAHASVARNWTGVCSAIQDARAEMRLPTSFGHRIMYGVVDRVFGAPSTTKLQLRACKSLETLCSRTTTVLDELKNRTDHLETAYNVARDAYIRRVGVVQELRATQTELEQAIGQLNCALSKTREENLQETTDFAVLETRHAETTRNLNVTADNISKGAIHLAHDKEVLAGYNFEVECSRNMLNRMDRVRTAAETRLAYWKAVTPTYQARLETAKNLDELLHLVIGMDTNGRQMHAELAGNAIVKRSDKLLEEIRGDAA